MARRRTARGFDASRPLEPARLAKILQLASLAPSAFNLQPWRFLVVRSPTNLARLLRGLPGPIGLSHAAAAVIVMGYHHPHRTDLGLILEEMIARGLISSDQGRGVAAIARHALETNSDPAGWAARTAMLAAATLMLASESLGVASAWVEIRDPEKLRDGFGIPDDHSICGLVALGYTNQIPADPGRLPLDQTCHAEHFGTPWTLPPGETLETPRRPHYDGSG